jgi:predicted ATP-dependent Lon-type protease
MLDERKGNHLVCYILAYLVFLLCAVIDNTILVNDHSRFVKIVATKNKNPKKKVKEKEKENGKKSISNLYNCLYINNSQHEMKKRAIFGSG